MKKIKIVRVMADNFQSWKHREVEVGDRLSLKGRNGLGKSTFEKIVKWVLLGIESKDDDIRPHNQAGEYIADSTEVSIVLNVDDTEIKLNRKRSYSADNSKKDEYTINNMIRATKKEYEAFINEHICDLELLALSMNIDTFFSKTLADRRECLIKWIAPISKNEVFERNQKLLNVADALAISTPKQIEKKCTTEIKDLKAIRDKDKDQILAMENCLIDADFDEIEKILNALANDFPNVDKIMDLRFFLTDVRSKQVQIKSDIENSKKVLKSIPQLIANQQRTLDLIKDYQQTQAELLEERVNQHFDLVHWKLFELLVNGELKETCKCTVGGSDFEGALNLGFVLLARIEILLAFQKANDIEVPCFIDNLESIDLDRIPKLSNQLIFMEHTDDKELVIE